MTTVFWLYIFKRVLIFRRDAKMFIGKMIQYLEFASKSLIQREGGQVMMKGIDVIRLAMS